MQHSLRGRLDGSDVGIESGLRRRNGGEAFVLLLQASSEEDLLNGLEKDIGLLLLGGALGSATDGTTGLVHVTGELVTDIEPLLLLGVSGELRETNLALCEDGLIAFSVTGGVSFVERITSSLAVDGVGGVDLCGLVRAVGGSLGIGRAIPDYPKDGELRRVSGDGVGGGGNKGGASGGDSGEGLAAGGLLLGSLVE